MLAEMYRISSVPSVLGSSLLSYTLSIHLNRLRWTRSIPLHTLESRALGPYSIPALRHSFSTPVLDVRYLTVLLSSPHLTTAVHQSPYFADIRYLNPQSALIFLSVYQSCNSPRAADHVILRLRF